MHEVLVSRIGGLSLPRKSVVRLTDRPDMTFDVYRGCKTTMQQQQKQLPSPRSKQEVKINIRGILTFRINTNLFGIFPKHTRLILTLIKRLSLVEYCVDQNAEGKHITSPLASLRKCCFWGHIVQIWLSTGRNIWLPGDKRIIWLQK